MAEVRIATDTRNVANGQPWCGVIDRNPAVVQNKKASAFAKAFLYFSGAKGSRTLDPHNAIVVLYQLSYDPEMSRLRLPCEEVIKDMRNR